MNSLIPRFLAVLLLSVPTLASAIPVQSGTGTWLTFRDCDGPAGSCSSFLTLAGEAFGGAPGELVSDASLTLPGYGTAQSFSALSGEIGAPVLRLFASSQDGARVNTNTFALQRYTYTGVAPTTRTFGGTLDYTQLIADPNNASYDSFASGTYASLALFTSLSDFVETGLTARDNFFNLQQFGFGAAPGYSLVGDDFFQDVASTSAGVASLSVTVDLNPGDSIWALAFMQTPAADGTVVDAFNTFVTGWDSTADLVPANVFVPVSVPEPGSLALFSLGLAGLGVLRRRRVV
jgi:PEP-CTERM putative exosortase interaction domain